MRKRAGSTYCIVAGKATSAFLERKFLESKKINAGSFLCVRGGGREEMYPVWSAVA